MVIRIICTGKTTQPAVNELVREYSLRLQNYINAEWVFSPATTKKTGQQAEWEALLGLSKKGSFRVLLDETGREFTSPEMALQIQKILNGGYKYIEFFVGGAYGFPADAHSSVNAVWSLSRLTFTHQMVRALLAEQIYRSFTIIKGEKYHHS